MLVINVRVLSNFGILIQLPNNKSIFPLLIAVYMVRHICFSPMVSVYYIHKDIFGHLFDYAHDNSKCRSHSLLKFCKFKLPEQREKELHFGKESFFFSFFFKRFILYSRHKKNPVCIIIPFTICQHRQQQA